MIVFQLTLKGWRANDPTPETEACIRWVKAHTWESLDHWLHETELDRLVVDIDTNPLPSYGFEDGVDVIIHGDDCVEFRLGTEPVTGWPEDVREALA